jgi:ribose transport system permease protein
MFWSRLRRLTDFREFMILLVIIVAAIAMTAASHLFLTKDNLLVILLGLSVESIVAIGMTVLLVSGGFDLSVGSSVGFCGAITALAIVHSVPVALAVPLGLITGIGIGCLNGFIVAFIGINPFITTLGMLSILRGLLQVVTQGKNISGLPAAFTFIGQGRLLGIQFPIILCVLLVIVGDILLRKSRFFRQNYYIGGNPKAALLSGIPVRRITVFNYALTGFLAALAGIVMTARFGAASVNAGSELELRVVSAVIIGGASLQGGEGTVLGAFLGSLLMALVVNALTLLNVDVYWNKFVIGATLLIAVLIDTLVKKRREA